MGGGGGVPIVSDVVEAVKDVGDFIQDNVIDPVKEVGKDVDSFVRDEIPGGWLTVGAATGAGLLGSGALGGAAAEGAAATGAFDAGVGGIAEAMGAGAAGSGAALGTGLTAGASGQGLVAPSVPSLASMGGGTGLVTEAAGGGLLSAAGVTAAGAVPMLGASNSFINNPAVIGNPVVGYQAGPAFSLQNAFRTAQLANNLFARPQQQVNPYQLMQQQQGLFGSVDYTPTINLLATRPIPQSLV